MLRNVNGKLTYIPDELDPILHPVAPETTLAETLTEAIQVEVAARQSVKQCSLLLSQVGTSAPVGTVLFSEITAPELTREAAGLFWIINDEQFTIGKTAPFKATAYTNEITGNKLLITPVILEVEVEPEVMEDKLRFKLETFAAADLETPADDILDNDELNLFIYS